MLSYESNCVFEWRNLSFKEEQSVSPKQCNLLQYREMYVGKPSVRAVVLGTSVCHLPLLGDHWAIQLHPHSIFNDLSHPANGTGSNSAPTAGQCCTVSPNDLYDATTFCSQLKPFLIFHSFQK
jgi:hypothetical protein